MNDLSIAAQAARGRKSLARFAYSLFISVGEFCHRVMRISALAFFPLLADGFYVRMMDGYFALEGYCR